MDEARGSCARAERARAEERARPVGLIAALAATAIFFAGGWALQRFASHEARRFAPAVAGVGGLTKSQSLTLQRAAFARRDLLPIYGSSELYCCGDPFRPTQLFATGASGFTAYAIGRPGVGNLLFAQIFGALGRDVAGKRVVVIDSPAWFVARERQSAVAYASNFSRQIAVRFAFATALSPGVRQAVAQRMLDHPETLERDTVLRLAVHALADPTPMHRLAYAALVPLGRLDAWIDATADAVQTLCFLRRSVGRREAPTAVSPPFEWDALVAKGTAIARRRDTTNPFGFPDALYARMRRDPGVRRRVDAALALYQSGRSNADGRIAPPDTTDWAARVDRSVQWDDLRLLAAVLRDLGVRPFIWTLPMPGAFDDYTPISAPVRRTYYERFEVEATRTGFPWLDFRDDDEDPWFLTDTGGHLSPRGWVVADRALDMFWHGRPIAEIRIALAGMTAQGGDS